MRNTGIILLMFLIAANCNPYDRTEAQRYYDLGMSYIKSELYEDGLKTLNQVAFLYPDSDVADDALYELAMIRERAGDGEIDIAWEDSAEAQKQVLKGLTGDLVPDMAIIIMAHLAGEAVFDKKKGKAIGQYLLALDYLNTLLERYPDSDKLADSTLAFKHIVDRIDNLTKLKESKPPKESKLATWSAKGKIAIFAIVALSFFWLPFLLD